jgi:predicted CoA-binding protein
VNPNADEVEGDACFHDLKSIPGGVEAVVMFPPTSDGGHRVMRWMSTLTGNAPRKV